MALHPMLIHFPIGLIYLAAGSALVGSLIYIFKGKLSKQEQEKINKNDFLGKLDFLIHVSIIITLLGLVIVIYTGFLDAAMHSQTDLIDLVRPWEVITGFKNVLQSNLLIFKMVFAITVFFLLIILMYLRSYYLKHANVNSIFNLDLISLLSIDLLIFTIMGIITLIGSVGGTYEYGHSILQDIPIVNLFLPTTYGFILLPIVIIAVLVIEAVLVVTELKYPNKQIIPFLKT